MPVDLLIARTVTETIQPMGGNGSATNLTVPARHFTHNSEHASSATCLGSGSGQIDDLLASILGVPYHLCPIFLAI